MQEAAYSPGRYVALYPCTCPPFEAGLLCSQEEEIYKARRKTTNKLEGVHLCDGDKPRVPARSLLSNFPLALLSTHLI